MINFVKNEYKLEVLSENNAPEIAFGDLPFWQGVQKVPGVKRVFPFRLRSKMGSPIQQSSGTSVLDEIIGEYKSEAYDFMTPPPGSSEWADELGTIYIERARELAAPTKTFRPKNVLEIGAGTLYVAKRMKELYQTDHYTIIDPSIREISDGFEIIREYFPHPKLAKRKFDLILSFNTLEHVLDPKAFLQNIRKYIHPSGTVVLVYPDCERQLKTGDLNVLVHEHINYFTEVSSRSLMTAAGFDVKDLRGFNDAFAVLLKPSAQIGRNDPVPVLSERELLRVSAKTFEENIIKTKKSVNYHLSRQGTVGFHGATNALNIFLFLTGLGNHPGIRIYDGDDRKVGKFIPASSTPIRSSRDETYSQNDIIIVSAMSYVDAIRRFALDIHRLEPSRIIPMSPG